MSVDYGGRLQTSTDARHDLHGERCLLRHWLNIALVYPSGQDPERGELLQRHLLRDVDTVHVRRGVADSFEASSPNWLPPF